MPDADYVLRASAANAAAHEAIHTNILSRLPGVARIHSSFATRNVLQQRTTRGTVRARQTRAARAIGSAIAAAWFALLAHELITIGAKGTTMSSGSQNDLQKTVPRADESAPSAVCRDTRSGIKCSPEHVRDELKRLRLCPRCAPAGESPRTGDN